MKEIASGIYAILNLLNGKRYVGSAVNLKGRQQDHFRALRKGNHHNIHLQRAFKKYGEDVFGWMVLEYIEDREMLLPRENLYLKMFPSWLLYNESLVAGSPMAGRHHSDKTKQKLSEAHKGRYCSVETRQKHREAALKRWANLEYRQWALNSILMLKGLRGEQHPMYGKHHSVETRRKQSEAQTGERHSMYGKHLTAETKRKMSEAHKRWWAQHKRDQAAAQGGVLI